MAVMMITGDFLSNVLRDQTLRRALCDINAEAMTRGGIEQHLLCSVRTPLSQRDFVEFTRHHHSQVTLQSIIQRFLADQAGGPNALDIKVIELSGWSHRSSSLPQCVVERAHERSTDVTMTFEWARGVQHSARVSF
jgi:hypothetical protein